MPESDQMQFLPSPLVLILRMILSCLPASVGIDVRGSMNVCFISFASEMLFPCDEVAPGWHFF